MIVQKNNHRKEKKSLLSLFPQKRGADLLMIHTFHEDACEG